MLPMLLLLIYVHRLVAFIQSSGSSSDALDFTKIYKRINEQKNQAAEAGTKFEFNIFNDTSNLQMMFTEVTQKGLLTLEYYEGVFGFLIFWYFFSQLFVQLFALLYYRKYVGK